MNHVSKFLLAPWSYGQSHRGVSRGPRQIWDTWNKTYPGVARSEEVFVRPFDNEYPSREETGLYMKSLYLETAKSLRYYQKTFVIGGDHSISAASVPAFFDRYREGAHLIWVDAHADLQVPETTPSGNTHGMPVSVILGLLGADFRRQYIPRSSQVTYVGLRSIDTSEIARIKAHNLDAYYSPDLLDFGYAWPEIVADKIAHLLKIRKTQAVYISLDVDVCDPSDITGTGTPVSSGLPYHQVKSFLGLLQDTHRLPVVGSDIVEFNPELCQTDNPDHTPLQEALNITGLIKQLV